MPPSDSQRGILFVVGFLAFIAGIIGLATAPTAAYLAKVTLFLGGSVTMAYALSA